MDRELDNPHEILSQREMDLEASSGNEEVGFEDIYSREIDRW
jgi:hypothetical protein